MAGYLNKTYQTRLVKNLPVALEKALALGGMIIKPYINNGQMYLDFNYQGDFYPIAFGDDGLTILSTDIVSAPDADTLLVYTCTVKNNSTSPIDISEMAMIMRVTFTDNVTFMWARDTFDTITMEPGEVRSFTMTISV